MIKFIEPIVKSTSVIINWEAIADAASYSLRFRPKKDDKPINIATRFIPAIKNGIANRGKSQLIPETEYVFELRAHLATSDTNWFPIEIKTPVDTTIKIKPCPPVNITKVEAGLNYAYLEWDPIVLEEATVTYNIRSKRADATNYFMEVSNTNSYKRTLPKNEKWILEVRGVGQVGNFGDWTVVEVKTDRDMSFSTKEIKEFLTDWNNNFENISESSSKMLKFLKEGWDGTPINKDDIK